MQTCVVLLVDDGAPDGASVPGVIVHPVTDGDALPDLLAERGGSGVHVLVLAEQRHALALGRARALLGAVSDLPVLARSFAHGPLALALLAEHAGSLRLPPAHVVASLDAAAAGTFSGAWTPSVAKLAQPAPSVGQHLRSWLPGGAGFLVEHAPTARVLRVTGSARSTDTVPSPGPPRTVLAVAGTGAPEGAVRQAARLAGTAQQALVAPRPGAAARYGSDSAVELAALPATAPSLPPVDRVPACRTCGLPVPQPACPYCRIATAPIPVESAL